MIGWFNQNNGFLMVIITFVYVVATILICIFNWRSAKASREQISESQRQQRQNIGLQLYAMRKDVVNKIGNQQFDDALWDMQLLFNEALFYEYADIGRRAAALRGIFTLIDCFEQELEMILPATRVDTIQAMISSAKTRKEYEELREKLKKALGGAINDRVNISVDEYIDQLKKADEMKDSIDTDTMDLVQKLRIFIQKSVQ